MGFQKKKHFKSTREYWIVPFSQTVPLKQNKFRSLKLLVFNSNIKKTHKTKIWIQSITIDCDLWIAIRSGSKSKKVRSRSKIYDRDRTFSDFDRRSKLRSGLSIFLFNVRLLKLCKLFLSMVKMMHKLNI